MKPYTPAEDAAIRSRTAPDGVLGSLFDRSRKSIGTRRYRLRNGARTHAPGPGPDESERILREEVAALKARVKDAARLLWELERTLAAKERELCLL